MGVTCPTLKCPAIIHARGRPAPRAGVHGRGGDVPGIPEPRKRDSCPAGRTSPASPELTGPGTSRRLTADQPSRNSSWESFFGALSPTVAGVADAADLPNLFVVRDGSTSSRTRRTLSLGPVVLRAVYRRSRGAAGDLRGGATSSARRAGPGHARLDRPGGGAERQPAEQAGHGDHGVSGAAGIAPKFIVYYCKL